jgi:hypothetical protein
MSNTNTTMSFTTKGRESKKEEVRVGKYISPGIHQLKIVNIEAFRASTGSTKVTLHMETPPVSVEGFEGVGGAAGQFGKVTVVKTFMKTDEQYNEFMDKIVIIADKLDVRDKIDAVQAEDFMSYVSAITPILKNKYAWYKVVGTQKTYEQEGSVRKFWELSLARWGFVASMTEGKDKLKFDKDNIYDYNPIVDGADGADKTKDDLPF